MYRNDVDTLHEKKNHLVGFTFIIRVYIDIDLGPVGWVPGLKPGLPLSLPHPSPWPKHTCEPTDQVIFLLVIGSNSVQKQISNWS